MQTLKTTTKLIAHRELQQPKYRFYKMCMLVTDVPKDTSLTQLQHTATPWEQRHTLQMDIHRKQKTSTK